MTEALRENVGKTADQLTGFDKVLAGVNLVSAQFGDTLGTKAFYAAIQQGRTYAPIAQWGPIENA